MELSTFPTKARSITFIDNHRFKQSHHQLQDARRRVCNTCTFQGLKVVTFPSIDKGLTKQIFEIFTTLEISS